MKIILTLLFIIFIAPVSFGQIFFKQRVYGMEDREPKEEIFYVKKTYNTNSYNYRSRKSNKTHYHVNNSTQEVLWKTAELKTKRKHGFYFIHIKETNSLTPLKPAIATFRALGKDDLANSINRSRTTFIVAKSTQIASWIVGVPAFMTIAVNEGDPLFVTQDHYNVLYSCIGVWVGSKITMLLCKASIENSLKKHNESVLENKKEQEKNFYQNFKPSSLTFKPVQISPLSPLVTPTLGFAWSL